MTCRLCPKEAKFKGLCKTCYHREYDRTPRRKAYKKAYNATEPRKEYSRRKSKTEAFKQTAKKFQKTEKFAVIQERYRMTEKARFGMGKRQAMRRGVSWDITYEQYQGLIQPICHYCDGKLSPFGINLDRKDNALPYTEINVVTCCGDCNRTKGDRLTYEEMVAVSELLKTMRKNKNAV